MFSSRSNHLGFMSRSFQSSAVSGSFSDNPQLRDKPLKSAEQDEPGGIYEAITIINK